MFKSAHNMPLQDAIDMFKDIIKREPELIPAKEYLLKGDQARRRRQTRSHPLRSAGGKGLGFLGPSLVCILLPYGSVGKPSLQLCQLFPCS